ncbi:monoglyceride lipase-like [Mytilus californianus]|uniref:monoglyceride lipase-like n=1 Tax=Mytilus californianus TaxID=6549 RepID=UPI002246C84D|nr:monoglyceride lipase-like [Mytilus californianus]
MTTDTSERFEKKIVNNNGKKLYCRYWNEEQQADNSSTRGLVFICHGAAEHCLYYTELAMYLIENGFYVFAHDHVGHGQSEGDRVHVETFDTYVNDVFQHVDEVKKNFPDNTPIFIIGHSMGGTISVLCGLERPDYFNGVILIGPALIPSPDAASPVKIFLGKIAAKVLPQLCVIKLDSKDLSRDSAVVKKYDDDPLVWHHGLKARWGVSFLKAMDTIKEKQSTIEGPFLTLHGDEDKLCDVEGSKKFYALAKSTDKEIKVYKGHYHQLHNELEEDKKVVLEDIKNWLIKRS